jgi:hypothetical protein
MQSEAIRHVVIEMQNAAYDRGNVDIWTVYDHPNDFPNSYVARRYEVGSGGFRATKDIVQGELQIVREGFRTCGLTRLRRAHSDDEKIVESWV